MEKSKTFNEEAGLKVIYEMIDAARSDVRHNNFYYLLWGILVIAACLLEYSLIRFFHYPHHYIGWPILMGAGMAITVWYTIRRFGRSASVTFIGNAMIYLFGGWTVTLLMLLLFVIPGHPRLIQPVSLAMYAMAVFFSGGVLRFRPLIRGGLIAWTAAIASFFSPFLIQLLITAGTVLIAYIIPGYWLSRKSPVNNR
jgi:hypothetical protein